MKMNFDPSFEAVSQTLHVTLGMLFVLIPIVHGIPWGWRWGSLAGVIWATLKEGIWDNLMESPAVRGSGWRDFIFYILGIVLGNLILWI